MGGKKKTVRLVTKRPPRQVFIVLGPERWAITAHAKKKDADDEAMQGERVVGPYVLAERVRER